MASNSTSPPVLNPHTPLAFLDPDIATQLQVVGMSLGARKLDGVMLT